MRLIDIELGLGASATVYTRFPEVHELLEATLASPTFTLYRSHELKGAEVAAAYARVIAFVWGAAHAMEQGGSMGATIFARGLAEIHDVIGTPQAFVGMSGAGNLFADVQEPFSVDVLLGREAVARGDFDLGHMSQTFGEAARELRDLIGGLNRHCEQAGVEGPIARAAWSLVSGEMDTLQAAHFLKTRSALDE